MTTFASIERSSHRDGNPRCLVLSIRPKYVDRILAGTKTIELRRTAPDLEPGTKVFIYASTPVKALVGIAVLGEIVRYSPSRLWAKHGAQAGVTPGEYQDYFDGADAAYGLQLREITPASESVQLNEMRKIGMEPPQSWRYVSQDLAAEFLRRMTR